MLLLLMPLAYAQVGVTPHDVNYRAEELQQPDDVCISGSLIHGYCDDGVQMNTCECVDGQWDCTDLDYLCKKRFKAEPQPCAGCYLEERCIPYGKRLMHDAKNVYCGALGVREQKGHNEKCDMDYECTSNECKNNRCVGPMPVYNPVEVVVSFFSWLGDFLQVK